MPEPRMAETPSESVTTHILIAKKSACGHPPGQPANWPHGHLWVKPELGYRATCPKCQRLLPEIMAAQRK